MEFKDRLKQLRKARNLSQQALADAIFVSRSAVAKWEAGLGLPNPDSMQALASFFGLTVAQLSTTEAEKVILGKNRKLYFQRWIAIIVAVFLLFAWSCPVVRNIILTRLHGHEFENLEAVGFSDVSTYGWKPDLRVMDYTESEAIVYYFDADLGQSVRFVQENGQWVFDTYLTAWSTVGSADDYFVWPYFKNFVI